MWFMRILPFELLCGLLCRITEDSFEQWRPWCWIMGLTQPRSDTAMKKSGKTLFFHIVLSVTHLHCLWWIHEVVRLWLRGVFFSSVIPNCQFRSKTLRLKTFTANQLDEIKDPSGLFYILPFQKVSPHTPSKLTLATPCERNYWDDRTLRHCIQIHKSSSHGYPIAAIGMSITYLSGQYQNKDKCCSDLCLFCVNAL